MGQIFKSDGYTLLSDIDPENMAAKVMTFSPATDAEALKLLRTSFPNCSLSMRVAALDYLMRRKPRPFARL
jgi:response regulator of citrate/malate metabolism